MAKEDIIKAINEALEGSKDRNFQESIDLAINLKDLDLTLPKNRIDEEIILPNGRGKVIKVAVFGSGEMAIKARDVADTIIQPEELEDLGDEKRKAKVLANTHDFFIAEAPLMPIIGKKLGIVLGPRGKMPRPVPPGSDPSQMIENLRRSVRARSKDKLTFHIPVGTREMSTEDVAENIETFLKRIFAKLERGTFNIRSIYIKTTMGPSAKLEVF